MRRRRRATRTSHGCCVGSSRRPESSTSRSSYGAGAVGAAGGGRGAARRGPPRARHRGDHLQLLVHPRGGGTAGSGRALDDAQRPRAAACAHPPSPSARRAALARGASGGERPWSADQHDEYKRFRYAVGDAITDVHGALNPKKWMPRAHCAACRTRSPGARRRAGGGLAARRALRLVHAADGLERRPDVLRRGGGGPAHAPPPGAAGGRRAADDLRRTIGTYASWLNRNHELLPRASRTCRATGARRPEDGGGRLAGAEAHRARPARAPRGGAPMAELVGMYHGTLALTAAPRRPRRPRSALAFAISADAGATGATAPPLLPEPSHDPHRSRPGGSPPSAPAPRPTPSSHTPSSPGV